jgi:DNA-binding NarL/FixJ family response regulator
MTDATRVLIVNNDSMMRNWLEAMLASHSRYAVVAAVPNGAAEILSGIALQPDVVLMSLASGWAGGIEAIAHIKSEYPHVKVIASALHQENEYINATLAAGADAYVLESDRRSELMKAFERVTTGRLFLSSGIDPTNPG